MLPVAATQEQSTMSAIVGDKCQHFRQQNHQLSVAAWFVLLKALAQRNRNFIITGFLQEFTMLYKKLLLIGCVFAPSAMAQVDTPQANYWTLNGQFLSVALDSDAARMVQVKDRAMDYSLAADYHSGQWLTTLALGFIKYKDLASFSQTVVGTGWANKGDVDEKSSGASALLLSAAFGPKWQFGNEQQWTAAVQAGYSHLARSERSIGGCDDCYREKIQLDAGAFANASLHYSFGSWHTGLMLRQHFSGDIGNSVGVTIGFKL